MAKGDNEGEKTGGIAKVAGAALKQLQSSIGGVGKIAGMATGGIGMLTSTLGGITGALTGPIDAIKSLAETIVEFVQLANPAVVKIFTLALNDAMAVLGHGLVPVMQGATIYIRTFGDMLAKIAPILQPLFNIMGQDLANSAVRLSMILAAMAPFLEMATDLMVQFMEKTTHYMALFAGVISEVITQLARVFGFKASRLNPDGSSQGASFRQAKTDSVEGFAKALFQKNLDNAMGNGNNGKKPDEFIPDIFNQIMEGQAFVRKISENVQLLWNYFQAAKSVGDSVIGGAKDAAGGFAEGITGIAGILAKLGIS